MIDKETIQQIIDSSRIDDVVGEFVSLKKRGSTLLGLCPFHNEKTPSFTVSPKRGIYKCFGCGKGGNVVNFLMEHEQFTYPEALRYLAKKYNIEIVEKERTPDEIKELNEREALFHLNDFAAKFFSENLFNHESGKAIGLTYFKERGFRDETIKKFQLGYSLDEWDHFTRHARLSGYNMEYLVKTGLTIAKEEKHYDRFRGRVMFPIHNISGRVLGFGGRTLSSEKTIPKYVNSPESDIYHKSNVLYGINLAKSAIIANDNCYLVEGYTDVISLHQAGIENVVASSGTSLTNDQVRLIRRYTPNITILYDGDEAGIKASFRGIDMVLEQGMDVKIVLFPDGEDPDSFARKHRSSEVYDFITKKAVNFIFFKTGLLLKETEGDPIKKAGLIKEIVGSISLIPNQLLRAQYIKDCSELIDVEEQTLMNELNKIRRATHDRKMKEKTQEGDPTKAEPPVYLPEKQTIFDMNSSEDQEKKIVAMLMNYGNRDLVFEVLNEKPGAGSSISINVASFIINDLKNDGIVLHNKLYQKVLDVVAESVENGTVPNEIFFLYNNEVDIAMLAATLLLPKYELHDWTKVKINVKKEDDNLRQTVIQSLLSFKLREIEKMYDHNQKLLKNATDETDIGNLLNQQQKILKKKKIISAELGRIVLR